MLVSVITPTRNRATSFLPDCIMSVSAQRLPDRWNLEHVVCDDGSDPDEITALLKLAQLHTHVRVVRRTHTGGVAAARNAAFLASRGDIVMDLDDDDLLPANALARRVQHLLDSGSGWACGALLKIDEAGRYLIGRDITSEPEKIYQDQAGYMRGLQASEVHAWASTRTYLRSALLVAGPWDESFPVAEDLEHWLRLTSLVGAPSWFPEYAAIFREKGRSLGIDALNDGSMAIHAARARARYQRWPELPHGIPTWADAEAASEVFKLSRWETASPT
jgi:glycosyltransferase involved in cell wall biosynthesis